MKKLDFQPAKSGGEFRKNYLLHDKAEEAGLNLLTQWGIEYRKFGEDNRNSRVWEKGEDKPDYIISDSGRKALIDWKAKTGKRFFVNRRAVNAYAKWSEKLSLPVFIAFFVFDSSGKNLYDRRYAVIGIDKFVANEKDQWDKNKTVEFNCGLSKFTKPNILKSIKEWYGGAVE
jgi:hypothetical protein